MSSSPSPSPDDDSPSGVPTGLRERNKAEKWRRILEAASRLFATNGFEATTTAAIAEEAGIGTGTLYLYVTSKEDLLVAVFRDDVGRMWDDAFAAVDPQARLLDQLLTTFGRVVDYHDMEPELARIFFKELTFVSPAMRDGVNDVMRSFFGQFTAMLDAAKVHGQLSVEVPSATLARNLWAQFYLLMQRHYAGTLDGTHVGGALADSFRVSLLGITPGGDPPRSR